MGILMRTTARLRISLLTPPLIILLISILMIAIHYLHFPLGMELLEMQLFHFMIELSSFMNLSEILF